MKPPLLHDWRSRPQIPVKNLSHSHLGKQALMSTYLRNSFRFLDVINPQLKRHNYHIRGSTFYDDELMYWESIQEALAYYGDQRFVLYINPRGRGTGTIPG